MAAAPPSVARAFLIVLFATAISSPYSGHLPLEKAQFDPNLNGPYCSKFRESVKNYSQHLVG
jgi:hypothetical protein